MNKRQRKSKSSRKKQINGDIAETPPKEEIVRLKRYRFLQLRSNPDFITFVKMARALNLISFGVRTISDYTGDTTGVGRRQMLRAVFMTAGYVHESILMIQSIRIKYAGEPIFTGLSDLAFGPTYEKERKILKEIRNNVAFHLDAGDKTTENTLKSLTLDRYDLMSGDTPADFRFILGEIIDVNYLAQKLKYDKSNTDTEMWRIILKVLPEIMPKFLKAGYEFMDHLAERLHLSESIEP